MEGIKIFPFRQGKGDLESAHHRAQGLMDCIVVPQGKAEGTHLFSGKPAPQSSLAVPFLPRFFGRREEQDGHVCCALRHPDPDNPPSAAADFTEPMGIPFSSTVAEYSHHHALPLLFPGNAERLHQFFHEFSFIKMAEGNALRHEISKTKEAGIKVLLPVFFCTC